MTKNFVIINSYLVGDMLLVNSLVQNIKRIYDDSKVIMLSSKNLYDISKYQEGVDDVIIWDRKGEHKSILKTLNFIKNFPYKDIYAVFPIYGMDRPLLLASLLNPKYNVFYKKEKNALLNFLLKKEYDLIDEPFNIQERQLALLSAVTKEKLIDCPIKFNPPELTDDKIKAQLKNDEYIALCPISSTKIKDIPSKIVSDTIRKINLKIVLLGSGAAAQEISDELKQKNLNNLIDLTNNTTLAQAGYIIKNAKATISCDTGLMHLACAVNSPTVCLFNTIGAFPFKPDPKLYKVKILEKNYTTDNIITALDELQQG